MANTIYHGLFYGADGYRSAP